MLRYELDAARARQTGAVLLKAYRETGIFGKRDMPEDALPAGVTAGDENHLRCITLSVSIDYQRDADQLWDAARRTYADPETRWLFDPAAVADAPPWQVERDMQRYKLSRKQEKDANIWQTVSTTLAHKFQGRVGALLDHANHDALRLLAVISESRYRFPYLKGPKIGPLWVRMLHDNCGVKLARIEQVPLPVDIHTAQATVQIGAVLPRTAQGSMASLRDAVQEVWRQALADPASGAYPLRADEPLWMLSRMGCRVTESWPCRFQGRCPVGDLCMGAGWRLTVPGNPSEATAEWTLPRREQS